MEDDRLWYVAYGSNVSRARLQRYLDRIGDGDGPLDDVAVTVDHALFFAHESSVWTGGSAFLDPMHDRTAGTLGRAWSVTWEQFCGVLRQENGDPSLSADRAWTSLAPSSRAMASPRRYGLVLACASPDDRPALTFTTPSAPLPAATQPADAYVDTIVGGLVDAHGISEAAARRYLAARGA